MGQQMLGPPSDPPFRFLLWEGQSSVLCASGHAEEDDSLGPPSAEGWAVLPSVVLDGL